MSAVANTEHKDVKHLEKNYFLALLILFERTSANNFLTKSGVVLKQDHLLCDSDSDSKRMN
jgi:hypothetical protein